MQPLFPSFSILLTNLFELLSFCTTLIHIAKPSASADFLNVMDEHTTAVTDTVSLDLTYFSYKFVESGFITETAASKVLSKMGVSAGYKSRELLHLARQNYKKSLKKQLWADMFIAIFSSQAAYSDLATLLRGETSTAGMAVCTVSVSKSLALYSALLCTVAHTDSACMVSVALTRECDDPYFSWAKPCRKNSARYK